ncbi:MAG TPA: porin [Polyangia bacterium]|nr:porin [Polyangia bacterium]
MTAGLTALLGGWAGTARAQEAIPAPPPAAPEAAPPEAQPSLPPVPIPAPAPAPDLSAKLDEADQIARIAARKVELLEEQLAARAKDSPTVLADDKGLGIRSADGGTSVRVHGLVQADSRWFLRDSALSDRLDTFALRRVRPSIDGTLFNLADYRVVPDFAGSAAVLFDAYADIHPVAWARLRAGKFKPPLGLERLQSDPDVSLPERALTQYLTPTRDVGASLWGDIAGGLVNYNIGIYNGGFDNSNLDVDSNHAKDFVGRLLIQPFKTDALKELGALGLHVAASRGDRRGLPTATLLPQFRSAGLNNFFTYLAPTPDADGSRTVFAYLTQSRLNPGLFYYNGPLGVQGEAVWSRQQVRKGNAIKTLTHKAAHATVSLVIGGKAGYDGATPTRIFDLAKGALGALEIAARWNWLKADDATFPDFADITRSASRAKGWAGAVNYVPSRTLRLTAAYERTTFSGGGGTAAAPSNRNTEAVVFGRVQVNF